MSMSGLCYENVTCVGGILRSTRFRQLINHRFDELRDRVRSKIEFLEAVANTSQTPQSAKFTHKECGAL